MAKRKLCLELLTALLVFGMALSGCNEENANLVPVIALGPPVTDPVLEEDYGMDGLFGVHQLPGTFEAGLAWIRANAETNGLYHIVLSADEASAPRTLNAAAVNNKTGVTIALSGTGGERTIQLSSAGNLFKLDTSVKLILGNNITLKGRNNNTAPLVYVNNADAVLKMLSGSKITGNTTTSNSSGAGVNVQRGFFDMEGGEICDNHTTGNADMSQGGGVYLEGIIGWNSGGRFTMTGGEIYGNTATGYGGGLAIDIESYSQDGSKFNKTGGVIYGYVPDDPKSNSCRTGTGEIASGRGHAALVFHTSAYPSLNLRESTAGEDVIYPSVDFTGN